MNTLQSENADLLSIDSDNAAALVVKRGKVDRVLADALYSCFPALAFSPEVVSELKTRFIGSSSIWETLGKLNSGEDLSLEKLSGLPGKAGWMELKSILTLGKITEGDCIAVDPRELIILMLLSTGRKMIKINKKF